MNSLKLHLSHLNYNYSQIQKQLNPKTQIVAVVKAGAYGSASEAIAKRLEALGVRILAAALANFWQHARGILLAKEALSSLLPLKKTLWHRPLPARWPGSRLDHCQEVC